MKITGTHLGDACAFGKFKLITTDKHGNVKMYNISKAVAMALYSYGLPMEG